MRVCLISPYPHGKNRHVGGGGLAAYSAFFAESLAKRGLNVVVLAERTGYRDGDVSSTNEIEVRKCWRKGSFASFDILRGVLKSNAEIVHLQHEFFVMGGAASAIQAPILLFLCRLARRKVVVTLHGVIGNSTLDARFLSMNFMGVPPRIARLANRAVTTSMVWLSHIVLVHDAKFRQILATEFQADQRKVVVLPHPVFGRVDAIPASVARRNLGLDPGAFVLGYIGFITGYKGIEVLIRSLDLLREDATLLRLLFAGSPHPRFQKNPSYESYIRNLNSELDRLGQRVVRIGFVPEEDLPAFFSACDALVFPYTVGISSSGPVHLGFAYRRPCLASIEVPVPLPSEYRFTPVPAELAKKLLFFCENREALEKQLPFIDEYGRANSWERYAESLTGLYEKLLADESFAT